MDELVNLYVKEFLDSVFGFALKKTSSRSEAEDLTQEISLEVISALRKGTVPNEFPAWVWRIARNRYARWADKKRRFRGNYSVYDLSDILSDGTNIEASLIETVELQLLQRELALLSHDFAHIIAAFYFENKSVAEIARNLNLPEGTVKRKLYECRNKLKEGMKMSRTYGKRSFSPEVFTYSQNVTKGEGSGKYLSRIIPQNILLEAYDNPSTAEDLSLALGIAVPYIQQEIDILLNVGLLLCEKEKYKTNMVILSKEVQNKLYDKLFEASDKFSPLLLKMLESAKNETVYGGYQSFDDMKMVLIRLVSDDIIDHSNIHRPDVAWVKQRPNNSEWSAIGYMDGANHEPYVGMHGCIIIPYMYGLEERAESIYTDPINDRYELLQRVSRGEINESDTIYLEELEEFGVVKKLDNGGWTLCIPVISQAEFDKIREIYKSNGYNELCAIVKEYHDDCVDFLKKEIPEYLHHELWGANLYGLNEFAIKYAFDSGYMKIPENFTRSPVGVWIYGD